MNERIKLVRKHFNLSQEEFGSKIGLRSSGISKIEKGINNPSQQTILSICREFDVSEEWLQTGQGEMFVELSKEELVAGLVAKKIKSGDPFVLNTLIALGKLGEEEWALLKKIVDDISAQYEKTEYNKKELDEETEKESN